ncbi:twin-arginine translocation signal domain-containing protein, partial [Trebonia sp.]
MLTRVEGKTSRRAFLGLAAAGVAAGVASGAAKIFGRPAASGHRA